MTFLLFPIIVSVEQIKESQYGLSDCDPVNKLLCFESIHLDFQQ